MTEGQYRAVGTILFVGTLGLALYWCLNQTGLAAIILGFTKSLVGKPLIQPTWLVTFLVLGIPGLLLKRYFDALAWNAHIENLPPPDPRQAARRSKYVKTDHLPPVAAQAVDLNSIPDDQMEFIATCGMCGHLFSARKDQKALKCPSCGEPIAVTS